MTQETNATADSPIRKTIFNRETERRVLTTVLCRDSDCIPKVPDAGSVITMDGERIQLMHNGVRVIEGAYDGAWASEIIRRLKGHFEPQEELAFHLIVERLRSDTPKPVMIELGAFWAYYSLWLLQRIPGARTYLVEPDPNNLEVGRRNFDLNRRVGIFIQASISAISNPTPTEFRCESDGITRLIPTESLPSLYQRFGLQRADIVLADIQGAEMKMLEGAARLVDGRQVRFFVISTHHHAFSGDPLTHQRCLQFLKSRGAHIIAEHSVYESFSGDGLIAASMDQRDQDLIADISYARARESLFGEVEMELARSEERQAELKLQLDILLDSTTFKIVRKCAPVIDRCFPEGTLRGRMLSRARKMLSTRLDWPRAASRTHL